MMALVGALPWPADGEPNASAGLAPLLEAADEPLVIYSEFGHEADKLWAADPDNPSERTQIAVVAHAPGYGIYPSLSPDGRFVAYTVLPTRGPSGPDVPAELRILELKSGEEQRLAGAVDLLITPVWSPDGQALAARRSVWDDGAATGNFELLRVGLDGTQTSLATSGDGLFPIAFTPDGGTLYFVSISATGTELQRTAGGAVERVAHLSDGVARDWRLSPDGTQLSYLAEVDSSAAFEARVLTLATGGVDAPQGAETNTAPFSPVWEPTGELTIGQLGGATGGAPVRMGLDGGVAAGEGLPAASRGFDVPISWSPSGDDLAVRAFEGASVNDPGPSRVVVLGTDGERRELSRNSDVIVAGWLEAAE